VLILVHPVLDKERAEFGASNVRLDRTVKLTYICTFIITAYFIIHIFKNLKFQAFYHTRDAVNVPLKPGAETVPILVGFRHLQITN